MTLEREETEDEVRWRENEKCWMVHISRFLANYNFSYTDNFVCMLYLILDHFNFAF
jgi:hypothetical protein